MINLTEFFGPSSPLDELLNGFQSRQGQADMAEEVAYAINEGQHLVVEAGTGIGKTFAYLVPAMVSGQKVIISTGTKTLQDQLYHRSLVDKNTRSNHLYQEYQKRKDELNLFTNDMEDIVSNDWFTKILPESWESKDTIAGPCYRICTTVDEGTIKGKVNVDTL